MHYHAGAWERDKNWQKNWRHDCLCLRHITFIKIMYINHLSPPIFPASWVSEFGEDRYGLWMAFSYKGVRQVLRWIQPGTFMMGSPEDEGGRYDDEDLHQVTLTQGFWLADTAVTQALWQGVMGNNPGNFKGDNRPVEKVSWNDVQEFIDKLNAIFKGLLDDSIFRLPSEAQWEYACRAGTDTPFNFEGELTLEQVNYRGLWEWESLDDWGDGALQKTVDVKSYPCNNWGLYEMHGNIWEWCRDGWQVNLGKQAVTDPDKAVNPDNPSRVVRGGSCFHFGRFVRSAVRIRNRADFRDNDLGFRLSLGLQVKPDR